MKKIIKLTSLVLGIILVIGMGVGQYFYTVAIHRDTRQGQSQFQKQVAQNMFDLIWYEQQKMEAVGIQSKRGYELDGFIVYHPDTVQHTMILSHGLGADKWTMMKLVKMYMDAGFNTILYDHTRHGSSGGDLISYGYFERHDLQEVVEFVKKRFPGGTIGVHGESFGGATSLMHAQLNEETKDVSFYVVDCPYSDLKELFDVRLNDDYGLPNLGIIEIASMITFMRHDFAFADISPKQAIAQVETPILFIHGEADDFVPTRMSQDLFEMKPGMKDLLIVPQAGHARAFKQNKELYIKKVSGFIRQVMPEAVALEPKRMDTARIANSL